MSRVWPASAVFESDTLVSVGGVAAAALAAEHGTPLYVVDRAEVLARVAAYRAAFGPDIDITYAAKALCVVGVLQLLASHGLQIDVASAGELHTAVIAGVPPTRMVMHGNNKSAEELRAAVTLGVGRVMVDNVDELDRLAAVAADAGAVVDVVLRITPGVLAETHAFVATGQDDVKFGLTLTGGLAAEAVRRSLGHSSLRLRGIHCHIGSQISATAGWAAAAQRMVALLAQIRESHGVELDELHLGGGLGIAYTADEATLDVGVYAEALRGAVGLACAAAGLAVPRLSVEPGRSLVGTAGLTLYTVGTVKQVPGVRTYAAVDGGMSDNLRPALYGSRYTVVPAGPPRRAAAQHAVTVAGKHCETGDVLARDVGLPVDLAAGDLLAVAATGAYGYSMASNYNRLPRPAMVLVTDGASQVLVRRETLDDLVRNDIPLP